MKKILLWCLCFLLIIALIPFCVGIEWDYSKILKPKPDEIHANNIDIKDLTQEEKDTICCISMEYIDNSTCKEAKFAVLSLCTNNYIFNKQTGDKTPKVEISKYSDELLKELNEILSDGLIELYYHGSIVYIPIVNVTDGYVSTADEYPYIKGIASPWDRFSQYYPPVRSDMCGISIEGLKYLCDTQSDAANALRWYLPDFEIKPYVKT